MEYERILLPVAGDGDVDPVVDHANSLAAALDAELLALHVVDPDGAGNETTAETREPEAVFEAVADRVDEAISLKRVTAEGEPTLGRQPPRVDGTGRETDAVRRTPKRSRSRVTNRDRTAGGVARDPHGL